MKNHAINQSTQLEYGVENYDTEVVDCDYNAEVVDCDYNAEVEYSACLFHVLFELCYRPLVQVEEPKHGQKRSRLARGSKFLQVPKPALVPVPVLVIYLKTPIYVF